MAKTYVLDTNVLIQAPYAMQCFEDNHVVIPLVVVEELDGLKKADGERGFNARQAIRFLERLRLRGNLLDGVALDNGGMVRIEINCVHEALPESLPDDQADNRILKVCCHLQSCQPILVTKDLVLRLKAQVLNIEAQDFSTEQVLPEKNGYTGRQTCYVPESDFDAFLEEGIDAGRLYQIDDNAQRYDVTVQENEFIILQADASLRKTHLGRVHKGRVIPLTYSRVSPYGIKPRNAGQYFMQEALMQSAEEAPLVIIKGQAGTAKTFYSLAVGLEKIINHPTGEYRRILICRPNAQFDSDIGFLPGDEQEKISPLMRPIIDNLEQLIDSNEAERYENERELAEKIEEIFDRHVIQTEALNFIRGRSLEKTYLIIKITRITNAKMRQLCIIPIIFLLFLFFNFIFRFILAILMFQHSLHYYIQMVQPLSLLRNTQVLVKEYLIVHPYYSPLLPDMAAQMLFFLQTNNSHCTLSIHLYVPRT